MFPALRQFTSRLLRSITSDRGVSTVIFALTLPLILGMNAVVIDGTRVFVERRALQNAADAAALAAASYLPSTNPQVLAQAEQAAIQFAGLNGYQITPADITFDSDAVANDRVRVRTNQDIGFFFAQGFGISLGAVGSHGSAQIGTVGAVGHGAMPWGVQEPADGFVFGDSYCLKLGSDGQGGACSGARQGNFYPIDIDDTGNSSANYYRDLIIYGSANKVRVGDIRNVNTGNMQGPTQQGTGCTGNNGRISGNNSTFEQVIADGESGDLVLDWSNSRIILIPIVTYPSAHVAEITGFAAFFLDDCGPNGSVVGRFLQTGVPNAEWAPLGSGTDTGTRVVRLVE